MSASCTIVHASKVSNGVDIGPAVVGWNADFQLWQKVLHSGLFCTGVQE